jgi:hypothetical protein
MASPIEFAAQTRPKRAGKSAHSSLLAKTVFSLDGGPELGEGRTCKVLDFPGLGRIAAPLSSGVFAFLGSFSSPEWFSA